jgi:hypothetical protein
LVAKCVENKVGRSLTKDSQIIKINPKVATNEIIEPTDEMTFQVK